MKTTTLLLFALLIAGCSSWTPKRTVTLHDVEPELAREEGADLRYHLATPMQCPGRHGCRDVVTEPGDFRVYQWAALCDGRFCGAQELRHVDVVRQAANIAFMTEQLVAALQLLRRDGLTPPERERLTAFVAEAGAELPARISATEQALTTLGDAAFEREDLRTRAAAENRAARDNLRHARELIGTAEQASID